MKSAIAVLIASLFMISCSSADKKAATATKDAVKSDAKAVKAAATKDVAATKAAVAKTAKKVEAKVEKATASSGDAKVVCTSGEVKREISVVVKDGTCTVEYTKDGETKEIATGTASSSHCKDVQDKVKGNLANAGYKCE